MKRGATGRITPTRIVVSLWLTIGQPAALWGATEPKEIRLSRRECIEGALQNNFDIVIERYSPEIVKGDITFEKSAFDPFLDGHYTFEDRDSPTASTFFPSGTIGEEEQDFGGTFFGKLILGTEYAIDFTTQRLKTTSNIQSLSPQWAPTLTFSLSQPLLRDFGPGPNKTRIRIAENQSQQALLDLKTKLIAKVAEVEEAYWTLVQALELREVAKQTMHLAQDLLRQNQIQVEVGTMAPIEVTQAKASVADRRALVIAAENQVRGAADNLMRLVNLPELSLLKTGATIEPTEKPEFKPIEVDVDSEIQNALTNRPEIELAELDIANKTLEQRFARNQLLPALSLEGAYGYTGLAGDPNPAPDVFGPGSIGDRIALTRFAGETGFGDSLQTFFSGNGFRFWSIGARVEIPLGNRAAESRHLQARLAHRRALIEKSRAEQEIALAVRDAARNIEASIKQIETARAFREFAEEQLEAEQKKLELGLSTSFTVLEFQEDLADAQAREVQALTAHNISLAVLEAAKGTSLEANGFEFADQIAIQ